MDQNMPDSNNILKAALVYRDAGLCVLPAKLVEKRPAVATWKQYQKRLPTPVEIEAWFANGGNALCILTGAVSGNNEMIDFDAGGAMFDRWAAIVRAEAPGLLERLVIERTQRSGYHVNYGNTQHVCGNMKLAQQRGLDGKLQTLIETRGEGGLFLCAPSPGYQLLQGSFTDLPILAAEERDILLSAAWALNEHVPAIEPIPAGSSNVGRPGDDFAARGDVRAVLAKHGWTLAKPGENEYWRRPGKAVGTSATLKDGVFYVFSSNADPFEPGKAYGPFGVYALLEHNGDYSAAAGALRAEGYGEDVAACPDVDLSGILGQAEPPTAEPGMADPGPIPEHLFHVPGFVSQVMDFTLANAPYPNVGLAFCGAMALQSYLCGRKVCDRGDLRPNIYLLALASSGTGKDFPRKVNSRVLFEIGHVAALGDKFASGEGIQDALARTPAMLFQNDEMDGVLRQINLDRENKRESIPNILLTLYTSANDVYPIRVKAGQKEASHIDQPHMTLFGTATPQYFYESLSQRMLTNGFFARLIIVDIGRRGEGQVPGSARHLPEAVLETARWWADYQPGDARKNLLEVHPEPMVIPTTPEAMEAIDTLQRQTEHEYDRAHDRGDEVAKIAWSRTTENAKKLALLCACSANHKSPEIDLPAVQWATTFAMHQTRRQLFLAQSYVAENPFHAECLKLLRRLREATGQQLGRNKLMRAMHCKMTDFDQMIATLQTQGDIVPVEIITKTKTAQGYRLA